MTDKESIHSLIEKYNKDTDLVYILERYLTLTESPISRSIDLFLLLDEKIGAVFSELLVIKLDSDSKDVERMKHLMELHFNLSTKIHEGLASGKYLLNEKQKDTMAKNERQRLFSVKTEIKSSNGKLA